MLNLFWFVKVISLLLLKQYSLCVFNRLFIYRWLFIGRVMTCRFIIYVLEFIDIDYAMDLKYDLISSGKSIPINGLISGLIFPYTPTKFWP